MPQVLFFDACVQADALADRIKATREASFAAVAGRMEASEERERAIELSLLRLGTAVRFSCVFGGGGSLQEVAVSHMHDEALHACGVFARARGGHHVFPSAARWRLTFFLGDVD
jgi:hypothetical protein